MLKQHPTESRCLWEGVTSRLLRKEYGGATCAKHVIEQRQRDEAAGRKRRGVERVRFSIITVFFFPISGSAAFEWLQLNSTF